MTALTVSGLAKAYGDAIALRGADLALEPGSIHGLVGENGAGKSTLVKVLSGMVTPDTGEILVDGEALKLGSPEASRAAGIKTAFQELSLLPHLSVAENLLISELPATFGIVRKRRAESKAAEIFRHWGVTDIDPGMPAGRLPLSAQQRLEIVRALYTEPGILILDEPTAALPDTAWIFQHVRAAAGRGAAVLYISHKLAEIEELCDRGSIMRNGSIVGEFARDRFEHDAVISAMIGRSIQVAFPPRQERLHPSAPVVLEIQNVRVDPQVRGVDLRVHAGEIVGVAGLEGQGQRELFYALAGALPMSSGSVYVDGEQARLKSPRTALRSGSGVVLVPEERKREGIFGDMTSVKNISVPALARVSRFTLIQRRDEFRTAREAGQANYLRDDFLPMDVGRLSGGNQQKTILARVALSGARIQLLFDPTRGIDPGAKLEVYKTMRKASSEGAAILLYSTEIPELIGMCDRIVVIYGGRVVAELSGDDLDESKVMAAAVGRNSSRKQVLSGSTRESSKGGGVL